jgi:polyhydroxyalkanoate synthesis regulator phasin
VLGATTPPAAEPRREGATTEDADKLREEVSALRDRLRSLEERLQKRKAESK